MLQFGGSAATGAGSGSPDTVVIDPIKPSVVVDPPSLPVVSHPLFRERDVVPESLLSTEAPTQEVILGEWKDLLEAGIVREDVKAIAVLQELSGQNAAFLSAPVQRILDHRDIWKELLVTRDPVHFRTYFDRLCNRALAQMAKPLLVMDISCLKMLALSWEGGELSLVLALATAIGSSIQKTPKALTDAIVSKRGFFRSLPNGEPRLVAHLFERYGVFGEGFGREHLADRMTAATFNDVMDARQNGKKDTPVTVFISVPPSVRWMPGAESLAESVDAFVRMLVTQALERVTPHWSIPTVEIGWDTVFGSLFLSIAHPAEMYARFADEWSDEKANGPLYKANEFSRARGLVVTLEQNESGTSTFLIHVRRETGGAPVSPGFEGPAPMPPSGVTPMGTLGGAMSAAAATTNAMGPAAMTKTPVLPPTVLKPLR